jgi:hypothetical protein
MLSSTITTVFTPSSRAFPRLVAASTSAAASARAARHRAGSNAVVPSSRVIARSSRAS